MLPDTRPRQQRSQIARTIIALREREKWSEGDLVTAINRARARTAARDVSRWERDLHTPSVANRSLLARIAAKLGHHDLARVFRAGPAAKAKEAI